MTGIASPSGRHTRKKSIAADAHETSKGDGK